MDGLALRVRQHDYNPTETVKMGGKVQTQYPRKNWSSLMLMNCPELTAWSKEAVETQSGAWLHRFEPIPDEKVGDISPEFNVLDHMTGPTKLLHYTSGGPWLAGCEDADHADLWHQYREEYEHAHAAALRPITGVRGARELQVGFLRSAERFPDRPALEVGSQVGQLRRRCATRGRLAATRAVHAATATPTRGPRRHLRVSQPAGLQRRPRHAHGR